MFRRIFLILAITGILTGFGPLVGSADACPMCKVAVEEDEENLQPRAYMYSILFMLAVPATLFGGIGVGLYRMNSKEMAAVEADELTDAQGE